MNKRFLKGAEAVSTPILYPGDTVGLIACSDGLRQDEKQLLMDIAGYFEQLGLTMLIANTVYRVSGPFSGSPEDRAHEFISMFKNRQIKAIFDVSGGDSANQILPYLDYRVIGDNPKPFFGISDLSVVLNALYVNSGLTTYHYSLRVLCGSSALMQRKHFKSWFIEGNDDLAELKESFEWVRGRELNGTVIGGNLRCFLKLAGTAYLPDPDGKIIFLESLGGGINRVASLLSQMSQMKYLDRCKGILLGTFTQMDEEKATPPVSDLVAGMTGNPSIPIIKTSRLGHGADALFLPIGKHLSFTNDRRDVQL